MPILLITNINLTKNVLFNLIFSYYHFQKKNKLYFSQKKTMVSPRTQKSLMPLGEMRPNSQLPAFSNNEDFYHKDISLLGVL